MRCFSSPIDSTVQTSAQAEAAFFWRTTCFYLDVDFLAVVPSHALTVRGPSLLLTSFFFARLLSFIMIVMILSDLVFLFVVVPSPVFTSAFFSFRRITSAFQFIFVNMHSSLPSFPYSISFRLYLFSLSVVLNPFSPAFLVCIVVVSLLFSSSAFRGWTLLFAVPRFPLILFFFHLSASFSLPFPPSPPLS